MIQSIISTLFGVIVPLSIPVILGVILARWKKFETKQLLTVVLYVLSPGIIFHTLTTAQISFDDVLKTILFSFGNLVLLWSIAKVAARVFKLPATETAGLTLISTLTNSVNYGLPLVLLAFGQLGLDKASIYVVTQMIIVNTIGVYFAARSRFSGKDALKSVFSLPAIYATVAAIVLRSSGLVLPVGIVKGVSMIAQAYSPMVLLILGAQMAGVKSTQLDPGPRKAFWVGMVIRMLLSPLIALFVLTLLGIDGILRSVLIVEASMPVAVNAVILAERFDAAPKTVSKCILWSTLASFVALPLLIAIVKM
ncbi:MAG: AEC family transporter [Treponemataceae bacterium]